MIGSIRAVRSRVAMNGGVSGPLAVVLALAMLGLAACAAPNHYDVDSREALYTVPAPEESASRSVESLPPVAEPKLESPRADKVVVEKSERRMYLKQNGTVLRSYDVALGFEPQGHKSQRGDGRTPEGRYMLDYRNPNSQFHRSIRVSYPNAQDMAQAQARGVDPGNNIMIHGLPDDFAWIGRFHADHDWTEGCIAVTNAEMDEIWALIQDEIPIYINP